MAAHPSTQALPMAARIQAATVVQALDTTAVAVLAHPWVLASKVGIAVEFTDTVEALELAVPAAALAVEAARAVAVELDMKVGRTAPARAVAQAGGRWHKSAVHHGQSARFFLTRCCARRPAQAHLLKLALIRGA